MQNDIDLYIFIVYELSLDYLRNGGDMDSVTEATALWAVMAGFQRKVTGLQPEVSGSQPEVILYYFFIKQLENLLIYRYVFCDLIKQYITAIEAYYSSPVI